MLLKKVNFLHVVSFGGQLQSASCNPVGDRPGQARMKIELDEKWRFIALTKVVNGQTVTHIVPMTNFSGFEAEEVVAPAPVKK